MTGPRFLVVAMPSLRERRALAGELETSGLKARLKGAMFDPANWHQSLSDRFQVPSEIERLRRACANVRARACTLTWNRIRCDGPHWAFRAHGMPPSFIELVEAVKTAFAGEGLFGLKGHSPHISISYRAPPTRYTHRIRPIQWTIDEILLVKGHQMGGHEEHYGYDVIDSWRLQPARQLDLFDGPGPG